MYESLFISKTLENAKRREKKHLSFKRKMKLKLVLIFAVLFLFICMFLTNTKDNFTETKIVKTFQCENATPHGVCGTMVGYDGWGFNPNRLNHAMDVITHLKITSDSKIPSADATFYLLGVINATLGVLKGKIVGNVLTFDLKGSNGEGWPVFLGNHSTFTFNIDGPGWSQNTTVEVKGYNLDPSRKAEIMANSDKNIAFCFPIPNSLILNADQKITDRTLGIVSGWNGFPFQMLLPLDWIKEERPQIGCK